VPSRELRRYCVLNAFAAHLACFDGVVARLARDNVVYCCELAEQIKVQQRHRR
jgi:hypothetical protein